MGNFKSLLSKTDKNIRKKIYKNIDQIGRLFLWESLGYKLGKEKVYIAVKRASSNVKIEVMIVIAELAIKYQSIESLSLICSDRKFEKINITEKFVINKAIEYESFEILGHILNRYPIGSSLEGRRKYFELIEFSVNARKKKCLEFLFSQVKKYKVYRGDRQLYYYDFIYSFTQKKDVHEDIKIILYLHLSGRY